jgi:hypothetical protein
MVMNRKGNLYLPYSEEDRVAGLVFPESTALIVKISGAKKIRSYRELCCYHSSCGYVADHDFNKNMNEKFKVDHLTRIECGFVKDTVIDSRGFLHWIVRELGYDFCEQPEAHAFISKALEKHAALVGVYDVDEYVRMLSTMR